MKIFKSLSSGALRSVRSWKGILIIWFFSLMLISLFVIPMKGAVKAGFGDSTITERLLNGLDIEVISDLGPYLASLGAYFISGFFFVVFLGILMNTFFAGGLFNSLKGSSGTFSVPDFFRAGAKYFWYFLGLYFMIILMIVFFAFLIVGLPVGLTVQGDTGPGPVTYIVGVISVLILSLAELIFLLVADYARIWLVSANKPAFFKALGFGFSETFNHFGSSYPTMLILTVIQVLFGLMTIMIIRSCTPDTGGGVFLLFIVSQILVILKMLLKAWRYGSVTSLMETNKEIKSYG
jgi:hypothetical protein